MSTGNQMPCCEKVETKRPANRRLGRMERLDPRYVEYQYARRRMLFEILKESYADSNDTLLWAVMVWTISVIALLPFWGKLAACTVALAISLVWTGVHRFRHA